MEQQERASWREEHAEESALTALASLSVVDRDAGAVFSGTPSGRIVKGFSTPSPFTPAIDADYIFHEQSRDLVVWFIGDSGSFGSLASPGSLGRPGSSGRQPDPLYVFGPTGCGKTSGLKQLAAKLNYPVFEVTGHSRLEFPELVGHHVIRNGDLAFEYGPLALAMKFGGLFLCNELDLLEPSTAAGLNGILDGQPLCIPENGGELITPHKMFRFAATANTNGGSDETGLYQGALRQNLALMDRFILCEVGYPTPEAEEQLLAKTAGALPANIRTSMVSYANEVRALFMGEHGNAHSGNSIEVTFSTRSLLRWAELAVRYQPLAGQGISPVAYALDRALAFRACKETRAMLHELVQRMFALPGTSPSSESGE